MSGIHMITHLSMPSSRRLKFYRVHPRLFVEGVLNRSETIFPGNSAVHDTHRLSARPCRKSSRLLGSGDGPWVNEGLGGLIK